MTELDEQLRILVQRFGVAEVRRRLSAIARPPRRPRARKGACDYVNGMNTVVSKKQRLLVLAQLFEEKRFLPVMADIRNFFEAYGAAPTKIKARQNAVPPIFQYLSSMSEDRLDRIVNEGAFGGPSELGPIAEAIKERSRSMGRSESTGGASKGEEGELVPLRHGRKAGG